MGLAATIEAILTETRTCTGNVTMMIVVVVEVMADMSLGLMAGDVVTVVDLGEYSVSCLAVKPSLIEVSPSL